MNYQDDTLTNASRNREASRKLFEHWRNKSANGGTTSSPTAIHWPMDGLVNGHTIAGSGEVHSNPSNAQAQQILPKPMTSVTSNGDTTTFDNSGNGGPLAPQSSHVLLHRSPSGAQRKIRQKAQQQQHHVTNGASNGISNSNSNAYGGQQGQQQLAYRSLIQENDYRSILNNEQPSIDASLSVGQLIDRMKRLEPLGNPDNGWMQSGSIDKIPATTNSTILDTQPTMAFGFSKPTVQVHPLPVPPRHRSMSVLSACSKPIPPPLPPKKHSLMMAQFAIAKKNELKKQPSKEIDNNAHWHESASAAQSIPSFSHSQSSSIEAEMIPLKEEMPKRNGSTNKAVNEVEFTQNGQFQQSPSPMANNGSPSFNYSPPSLSSSPSLTSLQNCLLFAVENPEKHSRKQLEDLEQRRLLSIESLAKKAAEREQDQILLERDLQEVQQLRSILFARLGQRHNAELLGRLRILLAESEQLAELEMMLHCQLARFGNGKPKQDAANGKDIVNRASWERRTKEQLNDLHHLRASLAHRERQLDAEIAEELDEAEALQEWLFCKEQSVKLHTERRQLEERLQDVQALIVALQAIRLLPNDEENADVNSEACE